MQGPTVRHKPLPPFPATSGTTYGMTTSDSPNGTSTTLPKTATATSIM